MNSIKDLRRATVAFVFFLLTVMLFVVLCIFHDSAFYSAPAVEDGFGDWLRLAWSVVFGLFGFTLAASFASFDDHPSDHYNKMDATGFAFAYGGLHFVSTIISSVLVYGVLTIIPATTGFIYYVLSAAISMYIGLQADIKLIAKLGIKTNT